MLREEYGQRVFENGVLRMLIWPKREEVAGSSILLQFEELQKSKMGGGIG